VRLTLAAVGNHVRIFIIISGLTYSVSLSADRYHPLDFDTPSWERGVLPVNMTSIMHLPSNQILVPQDYPTIQAAIDAAPERSTILVYPGKYQENIAIRKSLVLRAFPYGAMIEAEPGRAAVLIEDAGTVTFELFQIRPQAGGNNQAESVGIQVRGNTSALLRSTRLEQWVSAIQLDHGVNAVVEYNAIYTEVTGSHVRGISIQGAAGHIYANRLYIHSAREFVSGVFAEKSELTIEDNEIHILTGSGEGAAGLFLANSQGQIRNNQILARKSEGIVIQGSRGIHLQKNAITAPDSIGILVSRPGNEWDASPIHILDNVIAGWQSGWGGISINELLTHVEGNTITGHLTGIYIGNTENATIRGNSVFSNRDGIVINREAVSVSVENNRIIGNQGCGIRIEEKSGQEIGLLAINGKGNWISGNTEGNLCPADFPWPPGFIRS
jgi:parallel beta-helix repeat protein